MPIIVNDNIQVNAPKAVDAKYLKGGLAPYASINEAVATIPQPYRSIGLTVLVGNTEYWWRDGVTDSDLIIKTPSNIPQSAVTNLSTDLSGLAATVGQKAPLDSPNFTGSPTAPNPDTADNSTRIATTSFVKAIAAGGQSGVSSVNGFTGVVNLTKADVGLGQVNNTSDDAKPVSSAQQTALNLKANITSPAFLGIPTGPTAVAGTNSTQLATTAFVTAALAGVSGQLDAIPTSGSTAGVQSGGVFSELATKAPLVSPALTGTPTAPTATTGTNNTQIATTAFVASAIAAIPSGNNVIVDTTLADGSANAISNNAVFDALALKANLAAPAFTGTVTAPTPTGGDSSTRVATTAFVTSAISSATGANISATLVNAKDFGAVGDGIADDTTKIQAALDVALTAGATTIYLERGKIYRISATLKVYPSTTFNLNGASIKGTDAFAASTNSYISTLSNAVGSQITGLTISAVKGSNQFVYSGATGLVVGQLLEMSSTTPYANYGTNQDYFYGWFSQVIRIDTATNTVYMSTASPETFVINTILKYTPNDAVNILNGYIDFTNVVGAAPAIGPSGIQLASCTNSSIRGVEVFGAKQQEGAVFGIYIRNSVNVDVANNKVIDINIAGDAKYGIGINGHNVKIIGNEVRGCNTGIDAAGRKFISTLLLCENNTVTSDGTGSHCIEFHGNARGMIKGNYLANNSSTAIGTLGVRSNDTTVMDNFIHINSVDGLRAGYVAIGLGENSVDNIRIIRNTLRWSANSISSGGYAIGKGIPISGTINNLIIEGNDLEGDIYFNNTTVLGNGIVIRNNILRPWATASTTFRSIHIDNTTHVPHCHITGNTIYNNTNAYAIRVYGGDGSQYIIKDNIIHVTNPANVTRQILIGTTRCLVVDNTIYATSTQIINDGSPTGKVAPYYDKENFFSGNKLINWKPDGTGTGVVTNEPYAALPVATPWFQGRIIEYKISATSTGYYICVMTAAGTYAWQKITAV